MCFSVILPNKFMFPFVYWLLFYPTQIYGPKTKLEKILFWAKIIFLTLKLKLVNSIFFFSFGKTVKRPINNFSQTLAQMAQMATFYE